MPPTDSIASGKSSVWAAPGPLRLALGVAAGNRGRLRGKGIQSGERPDGRHGCCLARSGDGVRSAMKMTAITATSSTVPCRNSVGRSMATAPSTAVRPDAGSERPPR